MRRGEVSLQVLLAYESAPGIAVTQLPKSDASTLKFTSKSTGAVMFV